MFAYTARNKAGAKVDGTLEATDRRGATIQVERMGYVPVSIKDSVAAKQAAHAEKPRFGLRRNKMSTRDVLVFTTELSDLLASGMTLANALNCLANRKTGKIGDKVIAELRDEIVRGSSLSDALAMHPATFSRLYSSMIKAGETAGAIDEVLRRLVEHFERVEDTKDKVKMALVYPLIVLVLGAGVLVFSMVYVIPKFSQIFETMKQALPLPTRILIASSSWLARYGIIAAALIGVGVVMANRAIKTEKGRFWWDGFLLRMPLVRIYILARKREADGQVFAQRHRGHAAPQRLAVAAEIGGGDAAEPLAGNADFPAGLPLGVQGRERLAAVGAEQFAAPVRRRAADRQAGDVGRRAVRPEPFAVERHALHADHAGVADEHLQLPAAVQVAQLHVGDAAVRVLQGVLRIVGHRVPVLIQHVAALLHPEEGDDVAPAVGAGGRPQTADELLRRKIQLVPGDQLAVQPHLGQGLPLLDHQQPRAGRAAGQDGDVAGRFHLRAFPQRRELQPGRLRPLGDLGLRQPHLLDGLAGVRLLVRLVRRLGVLA